MNGVKTTRPPAPPPYVSLGDGQSHWLKIVVLPARLQIYSNLPPDVNIKDWNEFVDQVNSLITEVQEA